MRHKSVDPEFFTRNRERLRSCLRPGSVVILHSNDVYPTDADGTMAFRQNSDLFYLTGVDQEETILLLMPDAVNPQDREILFIRETNEHIAVWEGEKLSKEEAKKLTGITRVEWTSAFDSIFHRLMPQAERVLLETNEHSRATPLVETRNARFIKSCQAVYPLHRYERLAPIMHRLRMIKQEAEVQMIRRACDITGEGFKRLLGFIKPGVGEWEIEAELLHECVRSGSRGFAYTPIIGSGKNSCVLHYVKNDQVCREGELVLLDVASLQWQPLATDLKKNTITAAFSSAGNLFLGMEDGQIAICKALKLGNVISVKTDLIIQPHRTRITSLAFDASSNKLFSASLDQTANIFDLNLKKVNPDYVGIHNFKIEGFDKWIWDFALVQTGKVKTLLTVDESGELKSWQTGAEVLYDELFSSSNK